MSSELSAASDTSIVAYGALLCTGLQQLRGFAVYTRLVVDPGPMATMPTELTPPNVTRPIALIPPIVTIPIEFKPPSVTIPIAFSQLSAATPMAL